MAKMIVSSHLAKLSEKLCESARKGALNQSVLFVGREGIGKFSLVLNLAQTLLCERDMSACGECSSCREVKRLFHPDFLLLFPFPNIKPESKKMTIFPFSDPVSSSARFSEDTFEVVQEQRQALINEPYAISDYEKKDNIPVEVVRDLLQSLAKRPLKGGRRVVAALDIDKMAYGAADLFLKTVEEPPLNTHLLLTTSRPNLLYPTLLSRTQRIKVSPVPESEVIALLVEKLEISENVARYLSRISGGSPGIAINLHESEVLSRRDNILGIFGKLMAGRNLAEIITDVQAQYSSGKYRFDDLKTDFEIIESIVHDLYIVGHNNLDNHLINVDIKGKMGGIESPKREVLDIWNGILAETRKACTVNNVAADSGMVFFFISCAEAMKNLVRPKFTLP
jgi:DNA polymerase III delta prime subunit